MSISAYPLIAHFLVIQFSYGRSGRFPLSSRGYAVLKNSIIEPTTTGDDSIVEMLCEIDDAKLILERANRFYPLAAPYIEKALSGSEYRKTMTG